MHTADPVQPATRPQPDNGRRRVLRMLVGWTELSIALVASGIALAISISGATGLWGTFAAALLIGSISATVSLVPLGGGVLAGGQWSIYGFMGAMGARMLLVLLGCIAAVLVFRIPATTLLMMIVPFYLAQVIVEAWVLIRALHGKWSFAR